MLEHSREEEDTVCLRIVSSFRATWDEKNKQVSQRMLVSFTDPNSIISQANLVRLTKDLCTYFWRRLHPSPELYAQRNAVEFAKRFDQLLDAGR